MGEGKVVAGKKNGIKPELFFGMAGPPGPVRNSYYSL